ncbi:MAG: phosphatase PAP2 family protein [Anaerolineales bacterium]|nr:phosphatase PAP2 family protein [Anaerolineales bacterium]
MTGWERLRATDKLWTQRLCIAENPGVLRTISTILAHSGDSWFWGIGLAAVWIWGDPEWQYWALMLFGSILGTGLIVMTLKFSIRRRRPDGHWGKLYRKTDPHSFPSGHAARAALLLGMAMWLGPGWFQWAMLIYSPLMALARISMGVHYLSDVIAGYVLGLLLAASSGWWLNSLGWPL